VLEDKSTEAPVALVEVKAPISAGYDSEDEIHHSSLDPGVLNGKVRCVPAIPEAYRAAMEDAAAKYRTVVEDCPEFADLPFLVVFLPDILAETPLLDRRQEDFPEISGILLLVVNREMYEAASRMPRAEMKRRAMTGDMKDLPPPTKEWRLLRNPHAAVPVPAHLALHCLDGYADDPEDWDGKGAVPGRIVGRSTES
jgi:hypothetical protein